MLAALLLPILAVAQAPPPVPALPDAERRTSYVLAASTCPACSVGFALYGDGTDYGSWLELWLVAANGTATKLTAVTDWTLTSATGSLATIPRPITDATITLTTARTGTLQIIGARKPRRTSVYTENRGVAARDLNQTVNDIEAALRENWDLDKRQLSGLPGEVLSPLPSAAARASSILCWDATGLVPLACAPSAGGGGGGNVIGPNSSVDGHVALFSGTTGTILRDGGAIGTGNVTGPGSATDSAFALFNGTTGTIIKNGPTVIPLANGGTAAALTASNGGLVYSSGSAFAILSGTATANQIPLSGANTAPAWSTATYPATTTINQLLYSSAGNTIAGLATANSGVLVTSAGGVPSIGSALPNAVQDNITRLGTIASWTSTVVPIANGGTAQTTAAAARASGGLNVDAFTAHGDSIYTILATDRVVGTNAAFTASRTWTLPAANAVNAGQRLFVMDFQGTVTTVNTLVLARAGADTINGGTTVTIAVANGGYLLTSDGVSKWTAQAIGGVTSVGCGTGLTGGTITATGSCAVDIATATNFQAGAASKILDAAAPFTGETTTTFGATTTFNFSTFINTVVTLTANITTMNVSNVKAGQAGMITFIQDATGGRTATWNSTFKFAGGTQPVLSTGANAIDVLSYDCRSSSLCVASLLKDVR